MAFQAHIGYTGATATLHLAGELGDREAAVFDSLLSQATSRRIRRVVLQMDELTGLSAAGLRALALAQQDVGPEVAFILYGARGAVREVLDRSMFQGLMEPASDG